MESVGYFQGVRTARTARGTRGAGNSRTARGTGRARAPEEPIECFHVSIPPEDGENGYYISKPEVEITHVSGAGVTKYQFADSEGQMMEGELAQKDDAARIAGEQFKEGINRLSIWMEDGEGKQVEEYRLDKDFLIDTQAPAIWLGAPGI